MTASDTHRAIDAVWRIESARLIAGLARIVRDVGAAEELAQDALVAALEQWPESGVPKNPGAWLMATAKHRAIDLLRRKKLLERKHEAIGRELVAQQERSAPDLDAALDDEVGDDLLRLMFTACLPELSTAARVALTLRLLGGLTTDEIARAFLVSEATVAQRIVRAKRTLTDKQILRYGRSAAGNRPHDQKRLGPRRHCVRQWPVRRLVRQVLLAGEEPQERPALSRDVVANCPTKHRIAGLERVKDRADRGRAIDLERDLSAYTCQRSQVKWENDPDHVSVWTSTETTAGRSRTIGDQLSPASADA
jgi:RNA polymerase sigma factor (sigma-70 family)